MTAFVPLRALLPRGFDGILVTGLGVSAHRDAMPVIRMQPDVQNQGYACGVAAAMVARAGTTIRQLDLPALQEQLVASGCLPESVLRERASWPMPSDKIAAAVADLVRAPEGTAPETIDSPVKNRTALAAVFAHPAAAMPMLEAAYTASADDARLAYAQVLAMLGNGTGADALLDRITAAPGFDDGWNYTGMGQFGRSESQIDSCIIALGATRDARAIEAILRKVELLDAASEFSHHRACATALEMLGDPRAAPALASVLAKPGVTDARVRVRVPSLRDSEHRPAQPCRADRAFSRCAVRSICLSHSREAQGELRHAQARVARGTQAKLVAAEVVPRGEQGPTLEGGRAAADRDHAKAEHRRLNLFDHEFLAAVAEGACGYDAEGLAFEKHLRLVQGCAALDERLAERAQSAEVGWRSNDQAGDGGVLQLRQDEVEVVLGRCGRPTADVESTQVDQLHADARIEARSGLQGGLYGLRRRHALARAARDPEDAQRLAFSLARLRRARSQ